MGDEQRGERDESENRQERHGSFPHGALSRFLRRAVVLVGVLSPFAVPSGARAESPELSGSTTEQTLLPDARYQEIMTRIDMYAGIMSGNETRYGDSLRSIMENYWKELKVIDGIYNAAIIGSSTLSAGEREQLAETRERSRRSATERAIGDIHESQASVDIVLRNEILRLLAEESSSPSSPYGGLLQDLAGRLSRLKSLDDRMTGAALAEIARISKQCDAGTNISGNYEEPASFSEPFSVSRALARSTFRD